MTRFIENHPLLALLAFLMLVSVGPYVAIWVARNDVDREDDWL